MFDGISVIGMFRSLCLWSLTALSGKNDIVRDIVEAVKYILPELSGQAVANNIWALAILQENKNADHFARRAMKLSYRTPDSFVLRYS